MSEPRTLLSIAAVVVLGLAAIAAGAWWYMLGPNEIASAELVPANAVAFVDIPNAVRILDAYQSSQAKSVIDSPNFKPLHDYLATWIGQKNVDLFHAFEPNLSGQSFVAITHFDYDHPEHMGLVAAMKPKAGLGDFASFLERLKATYPDFIRQGRTGTATVEGVDYQWIQGPGALDKICVTQMKGWIVTTWGEASLQDWIQRFRKQSTTSSLATDVNYRESLDRVGNDSMTMVYVNAHAASDIVRKAMASYNAGLGEMLARKIDNLGGAAVATRFEGGEIVDCFSFLMPKPMQIDAGLAAQPCPFDTLKFTSHDTHFYWAANVNWKQVYQHIKSDSAFAAASKNGNALPLSTALLGYLHDWAHGANLDVQHNIVDALGSEISLQAEWQADSTYPEAGLFVKVDKPDDFRPVILAVIDTVRRANAKTAQLREVSSNRQNFAMLNFAPGSLLTPTITEDGPYLGVFMTNNQAVQSFQREAGQDLTTNKDFARQIGDKRNGAAQILFLDSPYILDRAYRTAMPFISMASVFNKDIAAALKGREMPKDLTWLAPVGTWSGIVSTDEGGVQAYSISGIGNQGIPLAAGLDFGFINGQSLGYIPKFTPESFRYVPVISTPTLGADLSGNPSISERSPLAVPTIAPPAPAINPANGGGNHSLNPPLPEPAPKPDATSPAAQ